MKVYIVFMWQDDEYGGGHEYVWKVCRSKEKALEYAKLHPNWTNIEEYELE